MLYWLPMRWPPPLRLIHLFLNGKFYSSSYWPLFCIGSEARLFHFLRPGRGQWSHGPRSTVFPQFGPCDLQAAQSGPCDSAVAMSIWEPIHRSHSSRLQFERWGIGQKSNEHRRRQIWKVINTFKTLSLHVKNNVRIPLLLSILLLDLRAMDRS